MKKELADSLRLMQTNPTTGTAHNQQVISTQVETIFAIDELKEQIEKLNKTIESSEKQSLKLELSNIRLQRALLILTAIGTGVACYPLLLLFVNSVFSILMKIFNSGYAIPALYGFFIAGLLAGAVSGATLKYEKKFTERVKLKESLDIVLRDKDGNIKETRHIE